MILVMQSRYVLYMYMCMYMYTLHVYVLSQVHCIYMYMYIMCEHILYVCAHVCVCVYACTVWGGDE